MLYVNVVFDGPRPLYLHQLPVLLDEGASEIMKEDIKELLSPDSRLGYFASPEVTSQTYSKLFNPLKTAIISACDKLSQDLLADLSQFPAGTKATSLSFI